jgi:AcrR family transcriptional regulator
MRMARTHLDKRSRLLSAAVSLAYQNGFGATSLADIARETETGIVPETEYPKKLW